ncbi:hypothetical protein CSW50_02425 [Thermus scotoductus]|uniref:Uncharacterized protein n=1 Tax=Thermus scotoductus TaxID=37636 RepID=A0A430RAX8_THESC|nr:hypothetical protein [Thermus scotoductus]RTH04551.1 hypothetical protein CSW50_02425 [Thermus scotoductus]RTI10968.1 hypothetical protein CSW30_03145 [Thermus scotoductus]
MGAQVHSSTAALQRARAELLQVEQELRAYEEGWGGSPLAVNPAAYAHDWVTFGAAARARSAYLYLLERRRELRERIRRMGGGA